MNRNLKITKGSKIKYRIKSKSRFTIFITCIFIIMIFTTTTVLGANRSESITKPNFTQIVVEPGDTLWQLALNFGPKDQDTRNVVKAICQINELSGQTSIQPGEIILIPAYI